MKKWVITGVAGWILMLMSAHVTSSAYAAGLERPVSELRLSLRDAIEASMGNNPTVRLFVERIMAARGVEHTNRGPLLPNVSAGLSATRQKFFLGNFDIGTAEDVRGPFNVFDYRGFLTQNLFSLSLIQRWRAALTGVRVAHLEAEVSKRDTMATVGLLYVDALRAEAAVRAVEANLELDQQLLDLAEDRKAAGLATGLDVTRAQVQVQRDRQALVVAKNSREISKLNLIRAIGIDFDVKLILTDELKLVDVESLPVHDALAVARQNRFELKAQKRREKLAALTLSSVTSEYVPSLSFDGNLGSIGNFYNDTVETFAASLLFSIPIWDGGSRDGRISENRSLLRQEQIRMKDVSAQVTLEVRDALLTQASTHEQVLVSQEALRLALKELDLARERFAVGVANNLEVTNAQVSVALARNSLVVALSNFNSARINLARAQGRLESIY